jgi:hypothetical protein
MTNVIFNRIKVEENKTPKASKRAAIFFRKSALGEHSDKQIGSGTPIAKKKQSNYTLCIPENSVFMNKT